MIDIIIVDGSGTWVIGVTIAGLNLGVAKLNTFSPWIAPLINSFMLYQPAVKLPELCAVIDV